MKRTIRVPAHPDHPHRCPCCRGAVALGRVRPWTIGRCGECGLDWYLNYRRLARSTRYFALRCARGGSHRHERVQAQLVHDVVEIVRRYRDNAYGATRTRLDDLIKELEARWTPIQR
jgi:hypothetical protein